MVCVDVFESDAKSQTLRTLVALTILIIGDLFYLFITKNTKKFWTNKMAYINLWITAALVLGISVLRNNEGDYVYDNAKRDHAYYGILIGLLIYVPMTCWLSSQGYMTGFQSLCATAWGILITSLAGILTFMVAETSDIIEP